MRLNTILLLLSLSLALLLQGCGVAGVAAAGGGLVYGSHSIQGAFSDKEINFNISNAIYGNKPLYADNHITVEVKNGVVLLAGQATSATAKQQVEAIAKNTKGVKAIYNEITIGPPTSIGTQMEDNAITTQVTLKLLGAKAVDNSAIDVVTEDGTVYLMGTVTPAMADKAADVARRISGVKKVVKVFQYITT
tara:strand:- start:12753 stop:13328 length:576 start_codon:yes stop_codon:yes gene_type:complete